MQSIRNFFFPPRTTTPPRSAPKPSATATSSGDESAARPATSDQTVRSTMPDSTRTAADSRKRAELAKRSATAGEGSAERSFSTSSSSSSSSGTASSASMSRLSRSSSSSDQTVSDEPSELFNRKKWKDDPLVGAPRTRAQDDESLKTLKRLVAARVNNTLAYLEKQQKTVGTQDREDINSLSVRLQETTDGAEASKLRTELYAILIKY